MTPHQEQTEPVNALNPSPMRDDTPAPQKVGTVKNAPGGLVCVRNGAETTLKAGDAVYWNDQLQAQSQAASVELPALDKNQTATLLKLAPGAQAQLMPAADASQAEGTQVFALTSGVDLLDASDAVGAGSFVGLFSPDMGAQPSPSWLAAGAGALGVLALAGSGGGSGAAAALVTAAQTSSDPGSAGTPATPAPTPTSSGSDSPSPAPAPTPTPGGTEQTGPLGALPIDTLLSPLGNATLSNAVTGIAHTVDSGLAGVPLPQGLDSLNAPISSQPATAQASGHPLLNLTGLH